MGIKSLSSVASEKGTFPTSKGKSWQVAQPILDCSTIIIVGGPLSGSLVSSCVVNIYSMKGYVNSHFAIITRKYKENIKKLAYFYFKVSILEMISIT